MDEEITGIQGTIIRVPTMPSGSLTVLSSLCLLTNKKKHGPFGHEEEACFSESWDVGSFRGFYGRAGFYLDSLGCFLKAIP
ncbi:hypothetical protein L6452_12014 [Arctium lappa]|uniref:Uncharacterized protein n=1 Tax=Arctium lappa TaxID=4217 RepID=A0ACB9DQH1_ARCLA|nr:hypothetical protein L6452_12014 [Arctium lappa]